MPPHGGPSNESERERGKARSGQPLPPLVSAALDPAASSLEARLARLKAADTARYTHLGEVAQGGMGRILRVWDERLGREVAMKIVARELTSEASEDERHEHERRLARFVDEARITAQLDHPSIVPVYEIGLEPGGAVFFTMPLVRGEHLGRIFEHAWAGRDGWSLARAWSTSCTRSR